MSVSVSRSNKLPFVKFMLDGDRLTGSYTPDGVVLLDYTGEHARQLWYLYTMTYKKRVRTMLFGRQLCNLAGQGLRIMYRTWKNLEAMRCPHCNEKQLTCGCDTPEPPMYQ